jgi:PAS domain S-box-containing protein
MSSADRPSELYPAWLHTAPAQYVFAILAVATAAFARYGLDSVLGSTHAFILFYPTILVVSLLTGFYPALLATLLSAALGDYFFMAPQYSFEIGDFRDSITNLLFVFVGLSMAAVAHAIRARTARLKEFEQAVEGTEEMVAVIDRDCRYLIANRAFLAYRGMKREELLGRRVADVLNPGVFENALKDKLDECFRGNTVQFEMVYPYATRGERELLITYFPIQGRHGIDRIACILQDIADRRASERSVRLFRTLIDHSNDAVEVIDPVTLRFLDVNETSCRDLGYTKQELLGATMCEVTSGCDHMGCAGLLVELKAKKTLLKQMTRRRKNGGKFPVEVSLNYVELDRPYILAVSRDISERIEAERALRDSEDRYRDLVENSEDLVCTHDLQGQLLSVNPAPARILGYSVDELLSMQMTEFIAPEFRSQFELYLDRVRNNGADEGILCVVTRSGQERIWEYRNTLRTEGVAQPVVRGMAHDITEQTLAEQALRGREEDYRQFVAQSSEGIFREDLDAPLSIDLPEDELVKHILHDSYVAECNDAMAKMYGFDTSRQLRGKRLTEMPAADDPRNLEMTREYIRSGFRLVDRESHEIDVHGNPRVFRNSLIGIVNNGKLLRTWGIQRDVTEQAQLEHARAQAGIALRKSEEHFRMLVEQATDGIFVADSQGRYIDVNTAGAQMLGYSREEIIGLGITGVIAESEIARLSSETALCRGRGGSQRVDDAAKRRLLVPGRALWKAIAGWLPAGDLAGHDGPQERRGGTAPK